MLTSGGAINLRVANTPPSVISVGLRLLSTHQSCSDYVCAVYLTVRIEVAVDIRGRSHIGVTEPVLDHLHRYFVSEKERCAGVAEVVEAYRFKLVLPQYYSEVIGNVVRALESAESINVYAFLVLAPITLPHISLKVQIFFGLCGERTV